MNLHSKIIGSLLRSAVVIYGLLFFCPIYFAESGDQAQQELAAVSAAIDEIQVWLINARATQSQEVKDLQQAELQISSLSKSIATTQLALADTTAAMQALSAQSDQLESVRNSQRKGLAQAIRTAYMAGNQSAIKLLLNQENIAKSARMLHYHRVFTESQLASVDSLQTTLDEIAAVSLQLESKATQLDAQQQELKQELLALNTSNQQRETALAQLRAGITSRSSELEQLEIDQLELQQLIEQINRAIADIPASLQNSPFVEQRGKLRKPVAGRIITDFDSHYGSGDLRRQGITIGVSAGTPVQAIHQGRVVFSDWLRGTGLLVIVDHGEGYMSLYGANQALSKQAGDWVDVGDILAISGRRNEIIANQESDQAATNIYFEIRHHGEAQNPADWFAN